MYEGLKLAPYKITLAKKYLALPATLGQKPSPSYTVRSSFD